jgi:hypothetical protein
MGKRVRILQVMFNEPIQRHELPAFRGAIISKTDGKSVLFHNHLGEDQYLNRYPQIQYKYHQGKPGLLCLEHGVDEAHHFFSNSSWSVQISGRQMDLTIDRLALSNHEFALMDRKRTYRLRNWLGLNTENFKRYKALDSLAEQVQFLERILIGNLLSMAKGLDWHIEGQVEVKIANIERQYAMPLKGIKLAAFDLTFSTNLNLPEGLGLGKGAGQGLEQGLRCICAREARKSKMAKIPLALVVDMNRHPA